MKNESSRQDASRYEHCFMMSTFCLPEALHLSTTHGSSGSLVGYCAHFLTQQKLVWQAVNTDPAAGESNDLLHKLYMMAQEVPN